MGHLELLLTAGRPLMHSGLGAGGRRGLGVTPRCPWLAREAPHPGHQAVAEVGKPLLP